jgi:ATP-dependent Clp protease ATP-binding subunit ClpA
MPKINVYLPDELAAAVRAAGFPVSPVCQQALADAVRKVAVVRGAIEALRDPDFDPARFAGAGDRLAGRMTPRLQRSLDLAGEAAGAGARVGTGSLLLGIIGEGDNLGLRVLEALDVDLDDLRAELGQAGDEGAEGEAADEAPLVARLTTPARGAIAAALEAVITLGHNYVGCEHLLLGLLAEPDAPAARVLRHHGVEPAAARRVLTATLSGYVHARQTSAPAGGDRVEEIMRRLDSLEERLSSIGA